MDDIIQDALEPVKRLTRDLANASKTLSDQEARFLVDSYYIMQESRKRSDNQVRTMNTEPHLLLLWLGAQADTLEVQIKRALDKYSETKLIGRWMKSMYGVGPVIASGLMAHIDINRAVTAGHIWRFAGLDPDMKWGKGEKRPWNASLKTLTWKIGQCFMKFHNADDCFYGKIYKTRKLYEVARNDSGGNTETAQRLLETKNWNKSTDAYKSLITGKLPPAQIDGRARRYAVKIFLSHVQLVWWFSVKGEMPPKPFALAHLGHAHMIFPPGIEMIPGLREAMDKHYGSQD